MKISDLIAIINYKIAALNSARVSAVIGGDLRRVVEIDSEIAETEATLNVLQESASQSQ